MFVQGAAERDRVDLAAVALVPARDDESSARDPVSRIPTLPRAPFSPQPILVGVAELLENGRCDLCSRGLAVGHGVEAEMVLHNVGHGLCIGSATGPAAPDCVVYPGELVCHAVRDVCAGRCAGVGS